MRGCKHFVLTDELPSFVKRLSAKIHQDHGSQMRNPSGHVTWVVAHDSTLAHHINQNYYIFGLSLKSYASIQGVIKFVR